MLADGYDAELDQLRALQTDAGSYLLELEAREKARTGISTLKVGFNAVHGFYIEVSKAQDKVPDDLPPSANPEKRQSATSPRAENLEDKARYPAKDQRWRAKKALYEALLEQLLPHIQRLRLTAQWRWPGWTCWPPLPATPPAVSNVKPAGPGPGAGYPRWPPSGGGSPGRSLYRQRLPAGRGASCC